MMAAWRAARNVSWARAGSSTSRCLAADRKEPCALVATPFEVRHPASQSFDGERAKARRPGLPRRTPRAPTQSEARQPRISPRPQPRRVPPCGPGRGSGQRRAPGRQPSLPAAPPGTVPYRQNAPAPQPRLRQAPAQPGHDAGRARSGSTSPSVASASRRRGPGAAGRPRPPCKAPNEPGGAESGPTSRSRSSRRPRPARLRHPRSPGSWLPATGRQESPTGSAAASSSSNCVWGGNRSARRRKLSSICPGMAVPGWREAPGNPPGADVRASSSKASGLPCASATTRVATLSSSRPWSVDVNSPIASGPESPFSMSSGNLASSSSPEMSRVAKTTATESASRRRATNDRAWALAWSSHWASSTKQRRG